MKKAGLEKVQISKDEQSCTHAYLNGLDYSAYSAQWTWQVGTDILSLGIFLLMDIMNVLVLQNESFLSNSEFLHCLDL